MIAYHDIEGVTAFLCPRCARTSGIVALATIGIAILANGTLEPDPEVHVDVGNDCDCTLCEYSGAVNDFLVLSDKGQDPQRPAPLPVSDLGPNVVVLRRK